jgi:hypothetical protein
VTKKVVGVFVRFRAPLLAEKYSVVKHDSTEEIESITLDPDHVFFG